MRVVIDGTAGCGKTTFLQGETESAFEKKNFWCMKDLGYEIFGELIRGTIEIRKKKAEDPFSDWNDFFDIALNRGADFYNQAQNVSSIYFYDRGIPYLKIMASRYEYEIQKKYYDYCEKYRYDCPIFVFEPVASYDDMRNQKANPVRKKGYSYKERQIQHKEVISLYKSLGYEVVEVPVFLDGNPGENNRLRMKYMAEYIKL